MQATNHTEISNKQTVVLHRIKNIQAIFLADNKVILAVPWSGMHTAGARISGYVIAENHWHLPIVKRMLQ